MDARCPRCGLSFLCGADMAAPCPCADVALGEAALAQLRASYPNCLCLACLREVAAAQRAAPHPVERPD